MNKQDYFNVVRTLSYASGIISGVQYYLDDKQTEIDNSLHNVRQCIEEVISLIIEKIPIEKIPTDEVLIKHV